ncbi:MAG: hypothetical protein ACQEP3_01990 [Patescibacteria group bacterium]
MINLLPPEQKKKIYNEKRERIILTLLFFLVIFLLLSTTTMYGVRHYSLKVLEEKKAKIQEERDEFENVLEKRENIDKLNQRVSKIKTLEEEKINFPILFTDINKSITEETRLDSLNYERKDETYEITISGYTPNWEQLLKIENELEKRFKNINFSSDSWTQTEDISFLVKFEYNGEN